MSTTFELVCYALVFTLSFFLFKLIFVNPRSKYKFPPGPRVLPIIGHMYLLDRLIHQALHRLNTKYGPLVHVKIGSLHTVATNSSEFAKEFLRNHDAEFCHRPKNNEAIDYLTFEVGPTLKPYGPIWIYIKKISVSELLGSQSVHKYHKIRTQELHHMLGNILQKANLGETANLTDEISKFTNNITSQAMISKRCQEFQGGEDPLTLVREVIAALGAFNVADFIGFFKKLDVQGFRKKLMSTRKRYEVLIEGIMQERELERSTKGKRQGAAKDFLDVLLDSTADTSEVKLTRNHAKALLLEYLTAGTDSTAVAIEWLFAELINNPMILVKAREEIKKVVGNRLVEESDTPNLPYIHAIIKESLRLHPPICVIFRSTNKETEVRGYRFPAGSVAVVNLWSMGRNPEMWENPLEFRPERFLRENGEPIIDLYSQNNFNWLPFGSGRRNCSGMAFALQVIPVAVAALIQCFDWKVKGGKKIDMTEKPAFTIAPANDVEAIPIIQFNPPNLVQF